jgi:hypothetical protein
VVLQADGSRDETFLENGGRITDFNISKVTTDINGRWYFPYVPKSYKEINCHLTCSNYVVTRYMVPLGDSDPMNKILIIRSGFVVAGRVLTPDGKPINNATVQEQRVLGWRGVSTKTDGDGRFELRGLEDVQTRLMDYSPSVSPREITKIHPQQVVKLAVQAEGMAPQEQSVRLVEPTNTQNFILGPAQVFRGHVVDEMGNPLAGAVVRTDNDDKNQVPAPFEWLDKTDAEGKFEWTSAPAETIWFWFEADGHVIIRGRPYTPDGTEHKIVLRRLN